MSSRINIVDENNKIIGSKQRADVGRDGDIYQSSAIWLLNSKGEVLIAQRKHTKDKDPGEWGPSASGTVDEGENYSDNAQKELEEELGVKDIQLDEGPVIYFDKPRRQFMKFFIGRTDAEIKDMNLQEEEVEAARWVAIDELKSDLSSNSNRYVPMMKEAINVL